MSTPPKGIPVLQGREEVKFVTQLAGFASGKATATARKSSTTSAGAATDRPTPGPDCSGAPGCGEDVDGCGEQVDDRERGEAGGCGVASLSKQTVPPLISHRT